MSKLPTPIALIILDGWGIGCSDDPFNAVACARTPQLDSLFEQYPSTALTCSGEAVGLPDGQMGNSEVGHLNIGAGRVVYQELTRISKEIREKTFFSNPVLLQTVKQIQNAGGALHLVGLLSDGGVHSHIDHLYALVELAREHGIRKIYIHAMLDGRDVPPTCALQYVDALEERLAALETGCIATIGGRYYGMDRDQRWERVEKAYLAIKAREGLHANTAREAVEAAYQRGEKDEFVVPTVINDCSCPGMQNGDGIIFSNFRPDRARQLTRAFVDPDFTSFERQGGFLPLTCATMTQYDETLTVPIAFPPQEIRNTLGEVISRAGLRQLRIAETEKYAHVTYFLNGGEERPFAGEDRLLVPSPKVATYDLQPGMSAWEVTDRAVEAIRSGVYDFIVLNYANNDMVGHTGILKAAIEAVEVVDECVGRVIEALLAQGAFACVTADHGNADSMRDPLSGTPFTAHTLNPVPFILAADAYRGRSLHSGKLCDIAPTILELAGIGIPAEMTGNSLLEPIKLNEVEEK